MVQLTPNMPYITLRVRFIKRGSLQYISHLDLVRTMHKIIVRAGLPLWYTEGFNPKPKMIFAAPLSVGTESVCEYMDLRLVERISEQEAKARLNANMTDEMQVMEAYYPETKLTELKWLSYDIKIKTAGADSSLAEKCEALLLSDSVEVEKKIKDKKGDTKLVNIRPLIKNAKCSFDGEHILLRTTLSADASSFLNPEYIIKALRSYLGVLSDSCIINEYYSVLRTDAYKEDMTEFR